MSARLSTSPSLPRVTQRPWIARSKARARLFAALMGLVVLAGTSIAEWFLYEAGEPPLMMMIASDVFAGVLAALLIAGVLANIVDRTDALRHQLEMISQMNHHVRNGLQLIAYSAYHTHDQEAIAAIHAGAERIEWALREILGPGGLDKPLHDTSPADKKPDGEMSA